MKSLQQTIDDLTLRIGCIYYHRPLMYGGSADGVDVILHLLHSIWAYAVDRESEFEREWRSEMEREDCDSANFAFRYKMKHPNASEAEIASYVVEHWKRISLVLSVPIPHARLRDEFPPRSET
jgi:hypothetical protein